jgi:hypothetical protein
MSTQVLNRRQVRWSIVVLLFNPYLPIGKLSCLSLIYSL